MIIDSELAAVRHLATQLNGTPILASILSRMVDEVERLRAELRNVLASAVPNKRDHPTMSAAWESAEALLAGTENRPSVASQILGMGVARFEGETTREVATVGGDARCSVYDTACIDPKYCAAAGACCAGDPQCGGEAEHAIEERTAEQIAAYLEPDTRLRDAVILIRGGWWRTKS